MKRYGEGNFSGNRYRKGIENAERSGQWDEDAARREQVPKEELTLKIKGFPQGSNLDLGVEFALVTKVRPVIL